VRRRHHNANLAHDATPDARVDSIFKDARAALVRQFYYTAKRAQQTEREIRLRIPGWQPSPGEGPVAEWEREWLPSGFFSDDGQCALPEKIQLARDIAANDCTSNTMALLSVEPCDRGGACRVKVRLMVEAPGVILRPCRRDGTTPPQQQRPPDWTAYTDGSEDGSRAGWAYAVVMGGAFRSWPVDSHRQLGSEDWCDAIHAARRRGFWFLWRFWRSRARRGESGGEWGVCVREWRLMCV